MFSEESLGQQEGDLEGDAVIGEDFTRGSNSERTESELSASKVETEIVPEAD